jgi:hypothetical protein
MRLLDKIDADVRRINKNGTDLVSGEDSTVLAMKAQIVDLKKLMIANITKTTTLEEQNVAVAAAQNGGENRNRDFNRNKGRNNGGTKRKFQNWPKKEDKQTCVIDSKTYMYCGECPNNRCWNKTRRTDNHVRGFTVNNDTQKHANMIWSQTIANSEVFSNF